MTTQEMTTGKQLNFRLSPEEFDRFERVANHYGLPIASMLRMLVKREDDGLAADLPEAALRRDMLSVIETISRSRLATETEVLTDVTALRPSRRRMEALGMLISLTNNGEVVKLTSEPSGITHYVLEGHPATQKLTPENVRRELEKQSRKKR
jgi:hypothetical protein